MRRILRLSATAAFALSLLFGVTGCQYSYKFEVGGVDRAADGTPLEGVKVELTGRPSLTGPALTTFPTVTGPDGGFLAVFEAKDNDIKYRKPLPTWTFTLTKEGYAKKTFDIRLKEKPASVRTTTHFPVEWTLEAEAPNGKGDKP